MKPLVLYHANCADGFGAAFSVWLKLGDEAEYVPVKYGTPFLEDEWFNVKDREVYILDFSFPRTQMDFIFANAQRVVWLDHHKTAFEMYHSPCTEIIYVSEQKENDHVHLDNNKSGAVLAWEYFHPLTELPTLIQHIDDYDRWQFKISGTKEFNKALWSYTPWSFDQWRKFLADCNGVPHNQEYFQYIAEGSAILRAHDQNVQSVVKGAARPCKISTWTNDSYGTTYQGLVANCPPHLTSDVGHELATQSSTYGLCWSVSNKSPLVANCSLRSNGEYDVSAIASAFGGGGHRNAAGFEVPMDTLLGWIM